MTDQPWLRFWPEHLEKSVSYPEKPLFSVLDESAEKYGKKIACTFEGESLTYEALARNVNRFAAALRQLGVVKNTKVAISLPNLPQFVISFFAILKAGGTVVPCNPLYKEAELEHQLQDSQSEFIIAASNRLKDVDLYSAVEAASKRLRLKGVITTSVTEFLPSVKRLLAPLAGVKTLHPANTLRLSELIDQAPDNPPSVEVNPKTDAAVLQYTGGTTGVSKGAMLTHYNLLSNAVMASRWLPLTSEDISLCVLPFFHIYGLTTTMSSTILGGGKMVILPRFNTQKVLEAINREKVTVFCGVPAMYAALLNSPMLDASRMKTLKKCISGAAPLPKEVRHKFNEITEGKLVEGYGLTEASPITHCNPLDKPEKVKDGSIGIPFPDTDAKILDSETGTEDLALGAIGELAIRGPQIMLGYWNRPEETTNVFRDNWLLTGDIARMDEDGYFYIVDRKKDMINVGGLKVYPLEVEETLLQQPSVQDAGVVGIPDPAKGEVVKAYVVLKPQDKGKVTPEDIMSYCKGKLAPHKVPKDVEFIDSLPKTLIGKTLRRALRKTE